MDRIIEISDFTGIYELPTSELSEDRIESILSETELDMFINLLGDDALYRFLKLEHDEFRDFWGGTNYEVDGLIYMYKGFIAAVKAFSWFYVVRDAHQFSSASGLLSQMTENSTGAASGSIEMIRMYNRGVDLYNKSVKYVNDYMIGGKPDMGAEGKPFENIETKNLKKLSLYGS